MAENARYHGLDAARAIALLLGITLHAARSFVPGLQMWAIVDSQAGLAPATIVLVVHIFRMAVFFLMAGFFARLVCCRKGTRYFFKDRLRRILLPLVAGWLILFPFIATAWTWGARVRGVAPLLPQLSSMPLWQVGPLGLLAVLTGKIPFKIAHLWFLYYLLLFYAAALVLRPLLGRLAQPADGALRVLIGRWWGVLPAAALLAPVLLVAASSRFGIPNPESLVPVPATAVAYGIFFLMGWLLHRQPDLLVCLASRWSGYCGVFAVLAVGIAATQTTPAAPALYFFGYALAMWCGVLGFTGACMRFLDTPSRFWRYLSDSSYWMYLAHLPAIAFLQVAIADWQLHWAWKIALIHAVVLPPLVVSYHFLVRPTVIGAVLNGRRKSIRAVARPVLTVSVGEC